MKWTHRYKMNKYQNFYLTCWLKKAPRRYYKTVQRGIERETYIKLSGMLKWIWLIDGKLTYLGERRKSIVPPMEKIHFALPMRKMIFITISCLQFRVVTQIKTVKD